MASLYLARDPAIDRLVAIKVIREGFDDDELRARFAREARSAGRLRHPNIVTIFQFGEQDGQPFIVMEYIAGQTVETLISQRSPMPLARRLGLLVELCAGLGYAHHAGIVHRDVKPANLIVDADDVLKILDFGIARLADSSMTHAGSVVGTLNYMSPEQVKGTPVDHRSDIFAAGAVAYELLSYQRAFPGDDPVSIFHRILHSEPPPFDVVAPAVGHDVIRIVHRALEKDPTRRYQDLAGMRRDLEDAVRRLPDADTVLLERWDATAASKTQPPVTPPPRSPIRGTVMFNPGRRTTLDLLNRAQTEAYRASEAADRFEREGQRRIESDEANHHDFDLPLTPAADHPGAPPAQESRASGTRLRWLPLSVLLAGIALAVLSVVGALHFVGGSSQAVRVATANAHASSTAPDAAASVPTAPTTGSLRLKPDPTEGKANGGPGVGEADRDRDPAVGTPDAAGSPGGTEADQARQLAALKKQAADQLRRGNREQALAAASGALAVSRDDQDMKTLVDGLLNEAIGRAATADKMAVDAGATAYADGLYAQAREDEAEARRLSGERRSVAAVRAYWKAADSFNEAAAGGREKRGATDVAGIKQALETYRSAYENLDLEAIKRYRAPDAEQLAALEAALHVARAYQVEISSPSIAIDADAASASCEVVYRLTTKSEETPYVERQSTVFRLQRRGSAWVIVGVDVRAPR